ncbi:DUF485 domain-containing protein [Pseudothauera nasutitermitis]|uniref:DUF485 domain-containing protein n=1 Tax=Pseudothauera nasutitermitis TaxID=2565930 RepID=A0A4S4B4R0_9RHOO|nr:DUF485 domain-containing protein [Pseudothauera nasutitermitis]THF65914.1 DUF485 domain-containing protein [Pseudothauera nasutitermitis]
MHDDTVARIVANPKYQKLVSTRTPYGWWMTIIMMIVYYGFIAVIAFSKEVFHKPLGEGVMTLGIPVGFGVIVFTILITGIYVRRANTEFDTLTREIVEEVNK